MAKSIQTLAGEATNNALTIATQVAKLKEIPEEALTSALADLLIEADDQRAAATDLNKTGNGISAEIAWRRAGELDLAASVLRMIRDGALG